MNMKDNIDLIINPGALLTGFRTIGGSGGVASLHTLLNTNVNFPGCTLASCATNPIMTTLQQPIAFLNGGGFHMMGLLDNTMYFGPSVLI